MGQDYAEEICQAIDQIVSKRIEAISYDQTFTVTITDASEAAFGKYKVNDGTAEYYAYSTDTTFSVDDRVYVTVPNGDYTQQKIITGKYVSSDGDINYNYVRPFNTFVDISGNLLEGNSDNYACSLLANYPVSYNDGEKHILDRKVNNQMCSYTYLDDDHYYHGIKIWEADLTNKPLVDYSRLGIQAQFKSFLSQLDCAGGNYGLRLLTKFIHSPSASESNLYYQARSKIDNLVLDMPDALYNTYCEYYGLITDNQITTINTKSDYNALLDKLLPIYRQHYTWLMSHSQELELLSVDNLPTWTKWGMYTSFLDKLNNLQVTYCNKLIQSLNDNQLTTFNKILTNRMKYFSEGSTLYTKNTDSLADLFLSFLDKRKASYEAYYAAINKGKTATSLTETQYKNATRAQILAVAGELQKAREEFRTLMRNEVFNQLLTEISNKEASNEAAYAMNLDVSQMIGDPYGLESYTTQEAVFSIRNYGQLVKAELYFFQRIGKVTDAATGELLQNLSFYDKRGNDISFYDEVEFFGTAAQNVQISHNLFVKDPYICVGYALEDFDQEHVQLYTFSPTTYSAVSGMNDTLNKKDIHLRWLHKQDNNKMVIVDKDTTFTSDDGVLHYPDIRWYRYHLGVPSPDEYAGPSWERINQIETTYEKTEQEVTTYENMPEIAELQKVYLCFHEVPGSNNVAANESTYSASFTPEYKQLKSQHIDSPLLNYRNYSYTGYWTSECLEYYHLSEELAAHAFVGQSTSSMDLYGQSWEDVFLSRFVYHNNHYSISDYYTGNTLFNIDDHNGYLGYGCLHAIGFWEKFTLAYRLYWVYPDKFQKLGVDDLFRTGGSITETDWDAFKNKNLYTEMSHMGTEPYPDDTHTHYLLNTSGNYFRKLFTLFTKSFGEWGYVSDKYGMKDYRPIDDNVYQQLYNATLYLFQKIDDPTYTHTEIVEVETIKIPDYFHYVFTPDVKRDQEKIKVIISCLDDVYESNELVFTNENYVANPVSSDQAQGLYLWCADNTYGNYFIYGMNSLLINEKAAAEVRTLEAHFRDFSKLSTESDLVTTAERITWKIPYVNTMIQPYGIDLDNARAQDGFYTDATIDMDDEYVYITREGYIGENYKIDPTIKYTIAKSHTQTFRNNYIQCTLVLNGNSYSAVKEFSFGTMGTSGTDYTLIIDLDDNETSLEAHSYNPTQLKATARLYDSEGADITAAALEDGVWEWFWHPDTCGVDFELGKILLNSGVERNLHQAADYYDINTESGVYYTAAENVTAQNYQSYYYQKEVDEYKYVQAITYLSNYDSSQTYYQYNASTDKYTQVTANASNYKNYYIRIVIGKTYEYAPARELSSYDASLTYWIKSNVFKNTSLVNKKNYQNYLTQHCDSTGNVLYYATATNANGQIYFEATPALKATKDTYQKYYIKSGNVYIHPSIYKNDVMHYEPVQATNVTSSNYTNYYIYNDNYEYYKPAQYNPSLQYFDITVATGVNSTNYKSYWIKKGSTNQYYHPTDEMAYSDSATYYSIRESTNVNSTNWKYARRQLAQFEKPTTYSRLVKYYTMTAASAVNKANFKSRVKNGLYMKSVVNSVTRYTPIVFTETLAYDSAIVYYFISQASEVTQGNYKSYYIKSNNKYITPTTYDPTATYYKLTNEISTLINNIKVGDNTASINCTGDISLNNFLILGVRLKNWGNYNLETYLPIPIREVDTLKHVKLTLDENAVANKLTDYTYQAQTYQELIDSYNAQLKAISSNTATNTTIVNLAKEINAIINQAKETQRTELFTSNTYSTLSIAADKLTIPTSQLIPQTTSSHNNYIYTSRKFCEILQRIIADGRTSYNSITGMNIGAWDGTTWNFDEWGLIKSILWGFKFSTTESNGGAVYQSKGITDVRGWDGMRQCYDVAEITTSTNVSNFWPGYIVYQPDRVGVFIGQRAGANGLWIIECTSDGGSEPGVKWSQIANGGGRTIAGAGTLGRWTHYGKLPWINYDITTTSPTFGAVDDSLSGYEEALETWDELINTLTLSNNTTTINNTLNQLDSLFSTRSKTTAYEDNSSNILGSEITNELDKYYSSLLEIKTKFDALYYKYQKELQDTEKIVLEGNENSNTRAVAKAHLYGGFAADVSASIFTSSAAKYRETYANKYFANSSQLDAYFRTRKSWLDNNIYTLKKDLWASGIKKIGNLNIEESSGGTKITNTQQLTSMKEAYVNYIKESNSLSNIQATFKEYSNIFQLFLRQVSTKIIDPPIAYVTYANGISGAAYVNVSTGEEAVGILSQADYCARINSQFLSYYNYQLEIINNKFAVVDEAKSLCNTLSVLFEDEHRYRQQKIALEDARTSIHAFYKAKELTDIQFETRNEAYTNAINRINKKLVEIQNEINKQYTALTNKILTNISTSTDAHYSAMLSENIADLINTRNDIVGVINQAATLLDTYQENNSYTYVQRKYGYIVGPTVVTYPSSGESYKLTTNHNEAYDIFMFPNVEKTEGYWKIYNPHNEDVNYIGKFEETKTDGSLRYFSGIPASNVLEPAAVFSANAHQYGVQYVEVNVKDLAIPWLNEENKWEIKVLPGWKDHRDSNGKLIPGLRTLIVENYDPTKDVNDQSENVKTLRRVAIENSHTAWTQPIYTYQNLYPSGTVNAWNGRQLEMGDNYVLAAFMAAGKKNDDNTFSGVMLGDYSQDPKGAEWALSSQTGVYGFQSGAMTYAFKEDGSAFIGPAGKGRIQFDGTRGVIASAGYVGTSGAKLDSSGMGDFTENHLLDKVSGNQCGMMIDLDDSIIDMRGTVEQSSVIDDFMVRSYGATGAQVLIEARDPYFRIKTANDGVTRGNTIVNIGVQDYYLQSDNFGYDSTSHNYRGTKINLATGDMILAGNITWSGSWEDQQVQVLFSSGWLEPGYVLADDINKGDADTDSDVENEYDVSKPNYYNTKVYVYGEGSTVPGTESLADGVYSYTSPTSSLPGVTETTVVAERPAAKSKTPNNGGYYIKSGNSYIPYEAGKPFEYGVDYYRKSTELDNCEITRPEIPLSNSGVAIDWWNRANANGLQDTVDSEGNLTWPETGISRASYTALLNKNVYPIWHKKQASAHNSRYVPDHYASYSYDQGVTWSEPIKIDGTIEDVNLVASLLNSQRVDGIYNNGGNIGIRAAAIRTGLLYSRENSLGDDDNTFETIAPKVGCVIDLDRGLFSLGRGNFYLAPSGLNKIPGLQGKTVNGHEGNWVIYANGNFGVDKQGNMYARNGDFQGTIRGSRIIGGRIQTETGDAWMSGGTIHGMTITAGTIRGTNIFGSYIKGGTVEGARLIGGSLNIGNGQFTVNGAGHMEAQSGVVHGSFYVDELFIKLNDTYVPVLPTEVTIPVSFRVDEVRGAWCYGQQTAYVTETKNLWQLIADAGYTGQQVIVIQTGGAMENPITNVLAYEGIREKPTYLTLDYTMESKKAEKDEEYYIYNFFWREETLPDYWVRWEDLKNYAPKDFVSYTDVSGETTVDVTNEYTENLVEADHLFGYDAYISEAIQTVVYTSGSYNSNKITRNDPLNPDKDEIYGLEWNGTNAWVPTRNVVLFTTGDVEPRNVAIKSTTVMDDYK